MNSVFDNLQRIESYAGTSTYLVEPVDGMNDAFAGRSRSGRAVFVLVDKANPNRSIQSGALNIDVGVTLEAQVNGKIEKLDRALVVELAKSNSEIELYFSEICAALQLQLSEVRNEEDTLRHLKTLAEFFGFKQVSREMVKGLWGELLFASLFPDLEYALERWHAGSFGRVDFDSKDSGWEVKTAEGYERKHRLKLTQLNRANDFLVSMCVEESPAGKSLAELIEEIASQLPPDLQFKLRIRALSYASSAAFSQLRLKLKSGDMSPRLYKVTELYRPHVPEQAIDYVSGVSFNLLIPSDIDAVELLDESETRFSNHASEVLFREMI